MAKEFDYPKFTPDGVQYEYSSILYEARRSKEVSFCGSGTGVFAYVWGRGVFLGGRESAGSTQNILG